jgi:hypothetical protein
LFDGDPLYALDARIASLRDARAAAPRFSDAYWQADDVLAWLRMLRDDVVRTGALRQDAVALLELPPSALLVVDLVAMWPGPGDDETGIEAGEESDAVAGQAPARPALVAVGPGLDGAAGAGRPGRRGASHPTTSVHA